MKTLFSIPLSLPSQKEIKKENEVLQEEIIDLLESLNVFGYVGCGKKQVKGELDVLSGYCVLLQLYFEINDMSFVTLLLIL